MVLGYGIICGIIYHIRHLIYLGVDVVCYVTRIRTYRDRGVQRGFTRFSS
jgi:hypothetical protein